MSNGLVKYDAMVRAIAITYKVDEVKDIRDKALALEMYSRLAHNTENERRACEIRLRAERKAGQLSAKLNRSNPGKRKKDLGSAVVPKSKKLHDAGISPRQAKAWEKLAAVPDQQFEAALNSATKPTTNGIIASATPPKQNLVDEKALWLWGRLRDFERDAPLDRSPCDLFETMTGAMRSDVIRLAPLIAAWLRRVEEYDHD